MNFLIRCILFHLGDMACCENIMSSRFWLVLNWSSRNLLNFKKIWLLKFYFLEITDAKNVKKVIILIITILTITTTIIITMVTVYWVPTDTDSAVCLALGIKLWVSRYGPCPLTRGSQPWLHSRFTREPLKNSNAQASHFSDSDLISQNGWNSGVDIFAKFSVNWMCSQNWKWLVWRKT